MEELQIYRATTADTKLLSEMGRSTFVKTFGNTCSKADMESFCQMVFSEETVHKNLSDKEDYFFIISRSGKAVGYARIKEESQIPVTNIPSLPAIELKRFYFLEEEHGKGGAQKLMDFLFDFAREKNYTTMYLSVWEYNFRAKCFYEKNGFTNTGQPAHFPIGNTPQTDYWFIKNL